MRIYSFLLILISLSLFSCDDKEVEIPSYIHIETMDLIITDDKQGSNIHGFTDVWVTISGQFIGAFELPCKIPVLMKGQHEVTLKAGVKLNGISASRSAYTPLQNCTIKDLDGNKMDSIVLIPGEITYFNAEVKYKDTPEFLISEKFGGFGDELTDVIYDKIVDGDTIVYTAPLEETTDPDLVYEGVASGAVHLTKDLYSVLIESSKKLDVPSTGYNYIELDYKTDVLLRLGVIFNDANATQDERHFLRPTNGEWKKIYLNIVPEAAKDPTTQQFGATQYKTYITAQLPEDLDEAFIYLDNYKLIQENE